MDRLWAPWRMKYVEKAGIEKTSCIFCEALRKSDEESFIVYRGRRAFIIMNIYPYNTGHVMVAPKRHVGDIAELDKEELLELGLLVQAAVKGLRKALKPEGFNIGINLGRIAGAGVEDHIHVHVVPRWCGDTNFMPVIGETKVIPEAIGDTYAKIREPIAREAEALLGSTSRD